MLKITSAFPKLLSAVDDRPIEHILQKKYKRSSQLWTLLKEKIKAASISYIRFFTAVHTYDFHISTIIISCEVSALKWYGILFLPSLPIKRMSVDCRFTANFSQVTLTSHWYPIKLRGGVRHGASKLSKIKKHCDLNKAQTQTSQATVKRTHHQAIESPQLSAPMYCISQEDTSIHNPKKTNTNSYQQIQQSNLTSVLVKRANCHYRLQNLTVLQTVWKCKSKEKE